MRPAWSKLELRGLLEFVLFHGRGDRWPQHKRGNYWSSAGHFVQKRAMTSSVRSAGTFIISMQSIPMLFKIIMQLLLVVITFITTLLLTVVIMMTLCRISV